MIRYLVTAAALLTVASAHAQMSLPGKFEVTDTGAASYTIPISVVPGTAGLEPKLSLQYDSRSGNGLLGVGWSLAGLPAITRCGRTIAQDGQAGGVAYDANDRFCLDGQRLIAVNVGTYGADGTEYRTERESFSKIVSKGTVSGGSGPSWFEVKTKAGLVMEFGNTADSKIEAQGKTSVRVWALNKTSDTKGNAFAVRYTEDNANGEYRPLRINYTGVEGTATNNSVRFEYETRPDIVPLYQAGSLIKTTQRMTKVQVWQGVSLVREYIATYAIEGGGVRSVVTSIKSCVAGGACLPETTLSWASNQVALGDVDLGGFGNPSQAPQIFPGDYNGDGLTDILYMPVDGSNNYFWYIRQSTGAGFTDIPLGGFGGPYQSPHVIPGDYNGDGLTDILYVLAGSNGAYNWRLRLSNGSGLGDIDLGWFGNPSQAPLIFPGDYNGDGLTDILYMLVDGNNNYYWYIRRSTGTGFTDIALGGFGGPYQSPHVIPGDYNGDGLTDILYVLVDGSGTYQWYVRQSTGTGFTDILIGGFGGSSQSPKILPGDFNGDGLPDILYMLVDSSNNYYWYIRQSTGTGFTDIALGGFGGPYQSPQVFPGDYNGDGLTDILYVLIDGSNNYQWYVRQSTGTGFTDILLGGFGGPYQSPRILPGDYNGDGLPDIVYALSAANGSYSWRLRLMGQLPKQWRGIQEVSNSAGSRTVVTYSSLASGSPLHAKSSGASACAYPCIDMQGPLYVVSEVKSSNGLNIAGAGGEYRSTYRYAGARADLHGRGFLGFRQMIVKDEQTGVEQATTYRQDYPFTGLVASREKKLGTALLNRSTNSYAATDLGGTRRFPYLSQSLEESWELGTGGAQGAMLPVVRTDYEYDNHPHPSCVTAEPLGNVTKVLVRTDPGMPQEHSKQTVNCYANDIGQWFLGRLIHSAVTSTIPAN